MTALPARSRVPLAVAFVVLALLAVLGGGAAQRASEVVLSVDQPGPLGGRALALALDALGVEVRRDFAPPLEWSAPTASDARGVRAVLAPTRELLPAESDALLAWTAAGGDLVLALPSAGAAATWVARLGAGLEERGALDPDDATQWPFEPRARRVELGTGSLLLIGRAEDLASAPLLGYDLARLEDDDEPAEWVRARVPWRDDVVPEPRDDAVERLAALAAFARGRALWVDESAHGRGARIDPLARLAGFLTGTGAGQALVALAVLGALALFVRGARRAPPLPGPPLAGRGRSSLEHATALAEAWRRARPGARPARLLVGELRERLGAGTDDALLARRLEVLAARDAALAADAARVRDAADADTVAPRELTELARACTRLAAAAHHARPRARSSRPPTALAR